MNRVRAIGIVGLFALVALVAGCSSPSGGGDTPLVQPATYDTQSGDGATGGADAQSDSQGDATIAADADVSAGLDADDEDSGAQLDAGATDAALDALDAEEISEFDAGEEQDTALPMPPPSLYAHTKDTLYALDPDKSEMVLVGKFTFDKKEGLVTDIALDQFRNLFAITHEQLFQCDPDTAKCTWRAKLLTEFNGLTFIPNSLVPGSKTEALIGIAEKGDWNWIQEDGKGGMTMKKLGSYGGGWLSSGDAFSVVGIGTFATLKKKSGGIDSLAKVDAKTGKIDKVIGSTNVKALFGFAWWADVFYGFSSDGKIYVIDVLTGKATEAVNIKSPKGAKWWGAGVSTRANGA